MSRTDTDERVVVVDLQAQQARAIQSVTRANAHIISVAWKGDRIFSVVRFRQVIAGRAPTGTSIRTDDQYYWIWRVISMNRDGSNVIQMFEGQTGQLYYGFGSTFLLDELPADPNRVLIGAQDRNGTGIYRADVRDGSTERIEDGADYTVDYTTDINGVAVMRRDDLRDGSGYRIYRRAPGAHDWTLVTEARLAAIATNSPDFQVVGSGPAAGQVYVLARPENSDLLSLYLYNTATGELGQPISDGNSDGVWPWLTRRTREVMATCSFGQRMNCRAHDPAMQRHLNALDAFFQHSATISLVDMSDDGNKWLVYVDGPTLSGAYYLYELAAHRVSPVAAFYPRLDDSALSPTQVVDYQSRDGTVLWAYVTSRAGAAGQRPMIVMPHGGPEARDEYGYDPFVQFLASRGYVVLQPNFRGGGGFGRAFADAG
jgi:dipeptidyl aminopeptidase/acylaminoacyl peptidase